MLKAKDIMTKDAIWLKDNRSLKAAYSYMSEYRFHHLPVLDKNNDIVGIVSESDVLKLCSVMGDRLVIPDLELRDMMTRNVITCTSESLLGNIVATMLACRISSIPVVDTDGGIVGIVTSTDILNMFCESEASAANDDLPYAFDESLCMLSNMH